MQGRCAAAFVGVLIAAVAGARADEGPSAPRVRVTSTAAPSGRVVGTLVGLDDESLTIRSSGETSDVHLKRQSVTRLEVSRQRGNRGKAALIGFLTGAVAGAVLGAATTSNDDIVGPGVVATGAGVVLGAAGALLGLAASHGEKWESASPDGLHVTLAPSRGGGIGLRVAIRF